MADSIQFEKLLEPGRIGSMMTKNRIIKTAAGTGFTTGGNITDRAIAYYETLAKGGAGLIIFENCAVECPRGALYVNESARLHSDDMISQHKELTDAVHAHHCPIIVQLQHAGPMFNPRGGGDPNDRVAASALMLEELPSGACVPPRELSAAEVENFIDIFAASAERAKKAGYDGVEINGGHHHLINTFLSRFWNKRHDEYGCDSLENRARFMVNIVKEVKRRLGEDYPVAVTINALELGIENGTTLDESKIFAQLLEKAGADLLHARPGGYGRFESGALVVERYLYPELPDDLKVKEFDWTHHGKAITVPLGTAMKEVINIPVYVAGRLDPVMGEEILRAKKLDFIGMNRRLWADPELPNKVAAGRTDDIAPCTGCCYCLHYRWKEGPIRCRVNTALGHEREYEIRPAVQRKRVLIAGGGPSGMEAARVAALRGHEVLLYEKGHTLGGLMPLAAMVKSAGLEDIMALVKYLRTQITKLGITVMVDTEVDRAVITDIMPDVVIMATGGANYLPDIPGIGNRKVVNSARLHGMLKKVLRFLAPSTLSRLTKVWMPVGKEVIIIGGTLQGCQLAEFLVKRGRKVTIVDTAEQLGEGMLIDDPARLFEWLEKKGSTMLSGVTCENITDEGLVISTKDGKRQTLSADTIIPSLPLRPSPDLLKALDGAAPELYQIGDCREPGFMADAIADGARIGRTI
jgi:2,4-dienoyl-CoA reductase (NADPH2)